MPQPRVFLFKMLDGRVVADQARNHGRQVSLAFVQDLADVVAGIVQAKEESWHYATPKLDAAVRTVGIGVDGTCILQVEDGGRQGQPADAQPDGTSQREGSRKHHQEHKVHPEHRKRREKEQENGAGH